MTTFLGVWHQSLGVTSKWLRVRRGVRGGDSRLHCAVLPVVPLAGGRGSGYVARPPRKRAKTRQKPRTAPRCSVVSPCTGRNRASLRRSSEPLQASQARATLRRPAAPEDQSRRPRRTRLFAPRTAACRGGRGGRQDDASLRGDGAGVITASRGRVSSTAPHPDPGEVRVAPPVGGTLHKLDSSATGCAPRRT